MAKKIIFFIALAGFFVFGADTAFAAIKTISNAGGNWNTAATWSPSGVPTAADDVVATAASGNLTINAAAVARSINLTNYTRTVTHNAGITLSIGTGSAGPGNVALFFPSSGWN